jgi:hypothetical protein
MRLKVRRTVVGLIVGTCGALGANACFIDNPNRIATAQRDAQASDTGAFVSTVATVDRGPSLCSLYGGYPTAEKLASAAVTEVLADCRINRFFSGLDAVRAAHLTDCLGKQIGVILGCPGVRYDIDNSGVECKSMRLAHRTAAIRDEDMDAFIEDLIAVLNRNGVAQADIDAIAPGILSLRGDVVTNSAPGYGKSSCEAGTPVVDAGGRD